ncbi:MAG: GMC family oxidoreductase [bacterium]|nr:GMC family oxidoreductase [bacterium]
MAIIKKDTPEEAKKKKYDVCIIGSGPSGMTLANELEKTGMTLCVLESGKATKTAYADSLRQTESRGILIKESSRERILGGTSTTWSGLSSPLDTIDLDSSLPYHKGGWPIDRATLDKYYNRAANGYSFPSLSRYSQSSVALIRERGDLELKWKGLNEKIFLARVPTQNFGKNFEHIFENLNLDLYLDATVVELKGDKTANNITRADFITSQGKHGSISASVFIVATGGIENARLLLNSRGLSQKGVGNEHDCVGRYLMNHPKNYYGVITLNKPIHELPHYFGYALSGYTGYAGLRINENIQKQKQLLNSYVRFEPMFPWSDNTGVESLIRLIKKLRIELIFLRFKKRGLLTIRDYAETGDDSTIQNTGKTTKGWLMLFFDILRNIIPVSRYVFARLNSGQPPSVKRIRLRNFLEMEPRAENRVTLGEKKDGLGMAIPIVHHECSPLDKKSIIELHKIIRQELIESKIGTLAGNLEKEPRWPITEDSSHHMGTTRMGLDQRTSVVDENCKVHSVSNLYLAGASVFPTSGCSNPTMTIVALSIRLADHLKNKKFLLR